MSERVRAPRRAAILTFFVAGWLPAAWATRIPAIAADLGLSPGSLAVGILGLEGGAILGLSAGAALVGRRGSRGALRLGFAVFAPGLTAVALAPSLALLALALAAMALGNSVVDVALNAQGVELERRARRRLLAGLHAGHPLGLVAGGLCGTAAAAAGVPVEAHLAVVAVSGLVAALAATTWLVAEPGRRSAGRLTRPTPRLLLLGLLAFCAFGLDGAATNWSTVDLRTEHGASAALAAAAFTAFALALAAARVVGDRLVARHGARRTVRASAVTAAAGALTVVLAPTAVVALAGWAVLGLGVAGLAPTVLGAAARGEEDPAVAIATVTSIGYLGSFSGPPAIGALAQATGLSAALGALVAASVVLGLLAGRALGR